jgi:hypothetical protein
MTLQKPLNKMINEAKKGIHFALKNLKLSQYFQYSLKVSNPRLPQMHVLAKIHKHGDKMRPIISNINSAFQNLSTWLVNELGQLKPVTGMNVKKFCQQLKDVTLQRNEVLVSFDVI